MRSRMLLAIAVATLALVSAAPQARAANRGVAIVNFSFGQPTVAIEVGDSVTWTNEDGAPHTATSTTAIWDSGTLDLGDSFQRIFDQAGVFPYVCAFHGGMQGAVLVGTRTYLPLVIR